MPTKSKKTNSKNKQSGLTEDEVFTRVRATVERELLQEGGAMRKKLTSATASGSASGSASGDNKKEPRGVDVVAMIMDTVEQFDLAGERKASVVVRVVQAILAGSAHLLPGRVAGDLTLLLESELITPVMTMAVAAAKGLFLKVEKHLCGGDFLACLGCR